MRLIRLRVQHEPDRGGSDDQRHEHGGHRHQHAAAPAVPALRARDHVRNHRQHRQRQRSQDVVVALEGGVAVFGQRHEREAERDAAKDAEQVELTTIRADRTLRCAGRLRAFGTALRSAARSSAAAIFDSWLFLAARRKVLASCRNRD